MTTGIRPQREILIRREATRGDGRNTNMKQVHGALSFTPNSTKFRPTGEEIGSMAEADRQITTATESTLSLTTNVIFEEIHWFLSMGIAGSSSDGGGSLKTTPSGGTSSRLWTFEPILTRPETLSSYAIQYYDNRDNFQINSVYAGSYNFTYAIGQPVTATINMFGHKHSKPANPSANPTLVVPEDAVTLNTNVYVNDSWASLGTTRVGSGTYSAVVNIPTGVTPARVMGGGESFVGINQNNWTPTIEIEFPANDVGLEEFGHWENNTKRYIRLETFGSTIEGAITKKFIIDMAVMYNADPRIWGDVNGTNTIRLTGAGFDDLAGGSHRMLRIMVTNGVNELA